MSRMHKRPMWRGTSMVLAIALSVVAGACGSSGSHKSGSDTSGQKQDVQLGQPLDDAQAAAAVKNVLGDIKVAAGSTTRGVNGKVIRIGGIGTVKDATGIEDYPGLCDGAKARFERANREGGVNGYRFEYVGCSDDGGNPARNRDLVRDYVDSKKVFALLPYTSGVSNQGPYLNENHVPYFGWGLSPDYCGWSDRQFGFSTTAAISCTSATRGKAFFSSVGVQTYLEGTKKDPHELKAAFVGSADAASSASIDAFEHIGKELGMDVVYAKTPIPGTGSPPLSDYTPVAQEIASSGANFVALSFGPGPIFGLVPALRASNFTGDILIFFSDERLAALANQLDHVYAMTPNFGSPAFKDKQFDVIRDDLKAIGSDAPAGGSGTLTSYAGADLFIKALSEVKGDLTTEALTGVLNRGFAYKPDGNAICPLRFPTDHVVPSNCASLLQFDGATKSIKPIIGLSEYGKNYLFPFSAR
jgi:branched-chain amino acid transport system substrate-binding protein